MNGCDICGKEDLLGYQLSVVCQDCAKKLKHNWLFARDDKLQEEIKKVLDNPEKYSGHYGMSRQILITIDKYILDQWGAK